MRLFMIGGLMLGAADGQADDTLTPETPQIHTVVFGPDFPVRPVCEGDGCDAWLPVRGFNVRFEDREARARWGAARGGLAGALIGEEIGGVAGAIGLGALGAALGYGDTDKQAWQDQAKPYDTAWQRGDDIHYNPAHPLPLTPQYWGSRRKKDD